MLEEKGLEEISNASSVDVEIPRCLEFSYAVQHQGSHLSLFDKQCRDIITQYPFLGEVMPLFGARCEYISTNKCVYRKNVELGQMISAEEYNFLCGYEAMNGNKLIPIIRATYVLHGRFIEVSDRES